MSIVYQRHGVTVHHAEALDVLRDMPDASVDAVVTDPPYGLEFMGKDWDSFRTGGKQPKIGDADGTPFRRNTGTPAWAGSGNPCCLNCGGTKYDRTRPNGCKCNAPQFPVESAAPNRAFQTWCEEWARECLRVLKPGGHLAAFGGTRTYHRLTCAIEEAGFEIRDSIGIAVGAWVHGQGMPKHKSQLKPAWEPIVVARRPLAGTYEHNRLAHGTGALNIDATRTGMSDADAASINAKHAGMDVDAYERAAGSSLNLSVNLIPLKAAEAHSGGRWPANVLLSHCALTDEHGQPVGDACAESCIPGCAVAELDGQSGVTSSTAASGVKRHGRSGGIMGEVGELRDGRPEGHNDSGGASRFFPTFRWEAKAPTSERPQVNGVSHPTTKPLGLIRWLVRLLTPPGGLVVDCFAGSGTTGHAARAEGMQAVLVEREADYIPLIRARLDARERTPATSTGEVSGDEPLDLLDLLDEESA